MRGRNTELPPLSRVKRLFLDSRLCRAWVWGPGATLRSVQAEPRATSGLLRDLLLRGGQSWAWMKGSPPHLAELYLLSTCRGGVWPPSHAAPGQPGSSALREGRRGSGVPGPAGEGGPRT